MSVEQDVRTGISVVATIGAVLGALVLYKAGVIPSRQVVLGAVAAVVFAPFIIRHRVREAARAKALRASAFTRPPVPGTRRG